ncbi:Protein SIEVE ELEMENT OCCLUSION B [Camellia lanceoleosa]|uniref:Protein SIEVE ELEMENT OCCLUSION B n=1 Tax=Camellia lanceoleosa TaxID=1840588 RepID=A0ACC0HIN9_9ERIC|nr:Protein SIEVE ELEMENT OCCLUSION B [Camellia lanceoleosa]
MEKCEPLQMSKQQEVGHDHCKCEAGVVAPGVVVQSTVVPIVEHVSPILVPKPNVVVESTGMHGHADALEERTTVDGLDAILDELAYIMHKVSCELSCKCSSGADAHATTMAILNMLSNYSWDAKVRHAETFQMLIRLFEMSHVDNVRFLKALIYSKDDQLPLVEGNTPPDQYSNATLNLS